MPAATTRKVTIAQIKAKMTNPAYNKLYSGTGKQLSDVTLRSYMSNFNVLSAILNKSDFQEIADMDTTDVLLAIKQASLGKKIVTLRGYVSAMTNLFRYHLVAADPAREKLYKAAEKEVARNVNNLQESNETSDRITRAGKTWKDIIELRDEEKRKDDGGHFHLLLAMYTLIPPRRVGEYAVTEVYFDEAPEDAASRNYVLLKSGDQGASTMHMNYYKTVRSLGPYTARLPAELERVIRKNMSRFERPEGTPPRLILNEAGQVMASSTHMSAYVRRNFMQRIGTPLLVTDLRHIFITDYLSKQHKVSDRKKVGRAMGHDILSQIKYLNIGADKFTNADREAAQGDPGADKGDDGDEVEIVDDPPVAPAVAVVNVVEDGDGGDDWVRIDRVVPPPPTADSPMSMKRKRRLEALDAFIEEFVQKGAKLLQMYLTDE